MNCSACHFPYIILRESLRKFTLIEKLNHFYGYLLEIKIYSLVSGFFCVFLYTLEAIFSQVRGYIN